MEESMGSGCWSSAECDVWCDQFARSLLRKWQFAIARHQEGTADTFPQ